MEEKAVSDIVIANMSVEYVVAGERVEAILLAEPAQLSRIRVLLLAEDAGPYREDIFIRSNGVVRMKKQDQESEQPAGTMIKASE